MTKDSLTTSCYLFVYFAGEKYDDGENIYMAVSQDGLNWQDLNHNQPILQSSLGTTGIRDPFIIADRQNKKYYILATDLKVHGNNDWRGAQQSGSTSLLIWSTTNLTDWHAPQLVKVAPNDFGCVWAPEATYDPTNHTFLVYWASKTAADHYKKQRIYCSNTTDFSHFSTPKVYIDRPYSTIDTTITENNGHYFRFTKNETSKFIVEDQLDSLSGKSKTIDSPSLVSNQGVEGPTCYQLVDQGKWILLVDNYAQGGYYPLETSDLSSGHFTKVPSDNYRMPSRARHGTVISISQNEANQLLSDNNIR